MNKRVQADKTWCRFTTPKCNLHLPEEVEKTVDGQILTKEDMELLSKTDNPPGSKTVNPKTTLGTFVHSKDYTKFCRWLETTPGKKWRQVMAWLMPIWPWIYTRGIL